MIGTTGFDQDRVAALARVHELPVFYAPNFALGAVLMMRFAAEAGEGAAAGRDRRAPPRPEARRALGDGEATAALLPPGTPIHSVRLPGLVAHQEVIFGGPGQTLTIRHDTSSREAFVPGVLLALDRDPLAAAESHRRPRRAAVGGRGGWRSSEERPAPGRSHGGYRRRRGGRPSEQHDPARTALGLFRACVLLSSLSAAAGCRIDPCSARC